MEYTCVFVCRIVRVEKCTIWWSPPVWWSPRVSLRRHTWCLLTGCMLLHQILRLWRPLIHSPLIWWEFDRPSSLICAHKSQLDATEVLLCRSYCLLNMFRAPLCPSSWAQEYYTVVAACGISCCGFSSSWSGVLLRVMWPVCRMLQHPANRTHNPQLHTRPTTWKPQHEITQAASTVKYSWAPDDGHSSARNMLSKQ